MGERERKEVQADQLHRGFRPCSLELGRDSALHIEEEARAPPGWGGGTTVNLSDPATTGPADLECPASMTKSASCESVCCRSCWDLPRLRVTYRMHGESTGRISRKLGATCDTRPKRKENPLHLLSLLKEFQQQRHLLPYNFYREEENFCHFLIDRGTHPNDHGEEAWEEVLEILCDSDPSAWETVASFTRPFCSDD